LDLGPDGEHIPLPEVDRRAALSDGRLIGDINLDTLDGAEDRGVSEVASDTGDGRSRITVIDGGGLEHVTTEDGADSAIVGAGVTQERVRPGAGVLRHGQLALELRGHEPVRQVAARNVHGREGVSQVVHHVSTIDRDSGSAGEDVEARAGSGAVNDGRVELATQRGRETTRQLRIQAGKIATELVRERLDDRELVRGQHLRGDGGIRDRLLVGLINPVRLSVTGNDRDSNTATRDVDLPRSLHDDGLANSVSPNLLRNLAGQKVRNPCGSTVQVNTCHCDYLSKRIDQPSLELKNCSNCEVVDPPAPAPEAP